MRNAILFLMVVADIGCTLASFHLALNGINGMWMVFIMFGFLTLVFGNELWKTIHEVWDRVALQVEDDTVEGELSFNLLPSIVYSTRLNDKETRREHVIMFYAPLCGVATVQWYYLLPVVEEVELERDADGNIKVF